MRIVVLVVLALIPPTLIGSLVWMGRHSPAPEKVVVAARPGGGDADAALRALFDAPFVGAKVKDKVALYDEKGLFDYIDGAAPIFIERHFRKLGAAELSTPEGSDLVCDVYDMATPENALSIYNAEKSAHAKPVEGFPDAIAGPMSFVFRQGRYYTKLTAFDAKAEAVLPAVARTLKEKMQ